MVHKHLLDLRATAKSLPKVTEDAIPEGLDPEKELRILVGSTTQCLLHAKEGGIDLPARDLVTAGMCLLQGTQSDFVPPFEGIVPDTKAWLETPFSVPRTDEEAKTRSDELMASKKSKRERKDQEKRKKNLDDQGSSDAPPKRARQDEGNETAGEESDPENMEMDKSNES
jgi:hypothetical protein